MAELGDHVLRARDIAVVGLVAGEEAIGTEIHKKSYGSTI
jgi:hypothetical protein